MTKSWRKQRAEAAAKGTQATAAEATKKRAATAAAVAAEAARAVAETARKTAKAAAESTAAAARKALGPTPKAQKVKKARHVRPPKQTPAAKTPSAEVSETAAGRMLGHLVRKTMAKPGAKTIAKKGPGPG